MRRRSPIIAFQIRPGKPYLVACGKSPRNTMPDCPENTVTDCPESANASIARKYILGMANLCIERWWISLHGRVG